MHCYLINIRFLQPFASFGDVVQEHRAYLQQGYDQGLLLLSGPREDQSGGIVIARATDLAQITAFFAQDPYKKHGLAEHHIVPFMAAKRLPLLEEWLSGKDCAMITA